MIIARRLRNATRKSRTGTNTTTCWSIDDLDRSFAALREILATAERKKRGNAPT